MPAQSPPLAAAAVTAAHKLSPRSLPSGAAFPLLALVLFGFLFAAAAPSPIFIVLQRAWHFSASMLTVAFAVYAIALLASLLVGGALSDHVGRRPVVLGALLLETVAMAMFVSAGGLGALVAARVVQGIATGLATGALTAAVVEAAPPARKQFGALVGSVAPLGGLAVGALATGLAIHFSERPVALVFGGLGWLFALAALAVVWLPETAQRRPGALASLKPRMAVPARALAPFMRGVPVLVTVWALGGLYLGLAPSLLLHVFGIDSGMANGAVIATLAGVGAVAPSLLKRLGGPLATTLGMAAIVLGLLLVLAALLSGSAVLFFIAAAVAGVGFGSAFSALLQTLAPLALPHERGELFAAVFVVSYLAFSLPAMAAGLLVAPLGLLNTALGYTAVLLVLGVVGTALQWSALHASRRAAAVPA